MGVIPATRLVASAGRATVHYIALIRKTVGDGIGIKASGGVAAIEDGGAFMRAGATVVAMRKCLIAQLEKLRWTPAGSLAGSQPSGPLQ